MGIPLGWSLVKREQYLDNLRKEKGQGGHEIRFQGKRGALPIHTVPIELPVYRLANGRTLDRQLEYIAKNGKTNTFFSKDPDSREALTVQHDILREMLEHDKTDLLKYFQTREQDEPLILTAEGYVVNGNRRLCAMRLLFDTDPKKHRRFSHIRVVLLPTCTEQDVQELEATLQIQPDVKADYSWVAQALLIERQLADGWKIERLVSVHGMKEIEIKSLLAELSLGRVYLEERGHPNEYTRLETLKFAIKQLIKARKSQRRPEDKHLLNVYAFTVMDAPMESGQRLYALIPQIGRHLHKINTTLSGAIPELRAPAVRKRGRKASHQLAAEQAYIKNLVRKVSEPTVHETVRECIVDVIEGERSLKKEQRVADTFLKELGRARVALQTAVSALGSHSTVAGAEVILREIQALAGDLKKRISKR